MRINLKIQRKMRKILFAIIALAFGCLTADAQQIVKRYQDYVNQYKDIAIHEMRRYNIPASITLAQGILESGAGSSELCRKGNNHFGIKCHGWSGRSVYHDDDESQECFRAYDSAKESFEFRALQTPVPTQPNRLQKLGLRSEGMWLCDESAVRPEADSTHRTLSTPPVRFARFQAPFHDARARPAHHPNLQ